MTKNKRLRVLALVIAAAVSQNAGASDYAEDLRRQADKVRETYASGRAEYFHDLSVIARKADDAGENQVAAEILRDLFQASENWAQEQVNQINEQFLADAFHGARRLPDLTRFDRKFQPTDNFLKAAQGQALNTDLIQYRVNALESLQRSCETKNLVQGIAAVRKTGFFVTGSPAETQILRSLTENLECCFSWKPEISFSRQQEFETLYESGIFTEEARLRLESSRSDLSEARWSGDWIYRYEGREGRGEGVSQGILIYRKGEDAASLSISASRVSSTGRMNFPNPLSGEKRTLETEGSPLDLSLNFFEESVPVTGCRTREKK